MKRHFLSNRGFSIIEAVVGAGILSVVALSVVYLSSSDRGGISSSFSSKNESCRNIAHAVLGQISSNGNINFLTYINEVREARPQYSENFLDSEARWGKQAPVSERGLRPKIGISQYSVGALSGLSALSRSADYCTNFREVPDAILKQNKLDVGREMAVSMQIIPYKKSAPSVRLQCDQALNITPRSKEPTSAIGDSITDFKKNEDVILSVTVRVRSRIAAPISSGSSAGSTANNAIRASNDTECTAKQDFAFDAIDALVPMRVSNISQKNDGKIYCNASSELADLQGATFNKSGQTSLFMCRDRTADPVILNKTSDPVYVCKKDYGCEALQPDFKMIQGKYISGPDWFDCKYLKDAGIAPKLHRCLGSGGSVNVKFTDDSPRGTMVIGLSKMQRGCQAIIDVTEVDAGAQVSDDDGAIRNVAHFLEFKNFGREPGNRSCDCQFGKKFYVCDKPASGTPQACPVMRGSPPALASAENYTPGVIDVCDCYPNSCSCPTFYSANPSICVPPPPPPDDDDEMDSDKTGTSCPCGNRATGGCDPCPSTGPGPGPTPPGGPAPVQPKPGCPKQPVCRGTDTKCSGCNGGSMTCLVSTQACATFQDSNGCNIVSMGSWSTSSVTKSCGGGKPATCPPCPPGHSLIGGPPACMCAIAVMPPGPGA